MIKNFLDDVYIVENMSSKKFKELGNDFKLLTPKELTNDDFILKKIKKQKISHLLCSIGIIKTDDLKKKPDYILGTRNNKLKTHNLFKKQKTYQKKYNIINDLVINNDIILYFNKSDEIIEITGYKKNPLKILFYGKICNYDEDEELIRPYNCSFVECVASIRDINARKILYPILAYFANDNILICDRHNVTYQAKSIWYRYFDENGILDKYGPLDDFNLISNENYNNIMYHEVDKKRKNDILINQKYNNFKYENKMDRVFKQMILNKKYLYRKRLLLSLKKEHYLDWAFKLNNNFKKNIENPLKILINRHEKNKKLEKKINTLSDSFFHDLIFS
jgi:hypothetical protein